MVNPPPKKLRILERKMAIARAHFNQGYEKLPLIYTIVLYNGKEKWTSPETIADLFRNFDEYCRLSLKKSFFDQLTHYSSKRKAYRGIEYLR
ncbi:MAG: Rpn family recombination-promoting nuclease/putative transposase [Bacteroidota bacterium]